MRQLEIDFVFLPEQLELPLDFTPCQEYEEQKRQELLKTSISLMVDGTGTTWSCANSTITSSFQFRPEPTAVGYWEVSPGVQVWRAHRPNWLHQKMTKVFFGWKWNDR